MAGKPGKALNGALFRKLVRADIYVLDGLSQDIRAASSLGDVEFVKIGAMMLVDTVQHFTSLLDDFIPAQEGSRMSGPEEKGRSWFKESPAGIIENLRLAVRFYQSYINTLEFNASGFDEAVARNLDRERIILIRKLAFTVQIGKKTIERDDPSFWNETLEDEFREWLEYSLPK